MLYLSDSYPQILIHKLYDFLAVKQKSSYTNGSIFLFFIEQLQGLFTSVAKILRTCVIMAG